MSHAAIPPKDPLLLLARYAGSSLLLRALRLAYAYVKPKFLEPALLGLWNMLNLVPTYGAYLHLGSRNALEFRVPKLLSEGREAEAAVVLGSVYRFSLWGNALLAAVLLALALWGGFDAQLSFGLASMAPFMLLAWYHDQQLAVLKAEQRFAVISAANVVNALSLIVFGIPLVILWDFEGVCIGSVLSRAAVVFYLRWKAPLRRVGAFDGRVFLDLVREGAPVLAFVAGLTLLSTTDRLVIGGLLGLEAVGFYSVALVAAGFILQVPVSARDMLEPRLMSAIATADPPELWRDYLLWPLLNTACYFPFMIGGLAFFADEILALLLPRYLPSALPAVVLSAGCYFLAQIQVSRGILVAHRWQARVLPFQLAGVVIHAALSIAFVTWGWDIAGIALASGCAFAAAMSLTLLYLLRRGPLAVRDWLPAFATLFAAPAVSVALIVAILWAVVPGEVALLPSLAGFAVFTLLQAGLVTALRRVFPRIRPLRLKRGKG